jgi:hypothetical protein
MAVRGIGYEQIPLDEISTASSSGSSEVLYTIGDQTIHMQEATSWTTDPVIHRLHEEYMNALQSAAEGLRQRNIPLNMDMLERGVDLDGDERVHFTRPRVVDPEYYRVTRRWGIPDSISAKGIGSIVGSILITAIFGLSLGFSKGGQTNIPLGEKPESDKESEESKKRKKDEKERAEYRKSLESETLPIEKVYPDDVGFEWKFPQHKYPTVNEHAEWWKELPVEKVKPDDAVTSDRIIPHYFPKEDPNWHAEWAPETGQKEFSFHKHKDDDIYHRNTLIPHYYPKEDPTENIQWASETGQRVPDEERKKDVSYKSDNIALIFQMLSSPFTFPGHRYLGPGTDLRKKHKPVDKDDIIAFAHDMAYAHAKTAHDVQVADRKAIAAFFDDFASTGNWHSYIAAYALMTKVAVETFSGIIYPILPKASSVLKLSNMQNYLDSILSHTRYAVR